MKVKLNLLSIKSEWDECEVHLALTTGSVIKEYVYLFPSKSTWEQYYYKFSYPISGGADRKLKLSILASIKQYKRKE